MVSSIQQHKFNNGQGLVEYALLLGLVAIVVSGSLAVMAPTLNTTYHNIVQQLHLEVSEEPGIAGPGPEIGTTEELEPAEEELPSGPSYAELSAAVSSCVTHNGTRQSLSNAANHEDISTFTTLLSAHRRHISDSCYAELSSMASSMS